MIALFRRLMKIEGIEGQIFAISTLLFLFEVVVLILYLVTRVL